MATKTVEEKFDILSGTKLRDKDRILKISRQIDVIRENLSKKIKKTDSTAMIRKWRNSQ